MSGNKGFDTKVPDDYNTDSGFLSGPISEQLMLSEDLEKEENNSDSKIEVYEYGQLDSGLDLCLSECLSNVNLSDTISTTRLLPQTVTAVDQSQDIPPLVILFQQDEDGDTQLHVAAVHGCKKSVSTLVRVCPIKEWLDTPNDYSHTALHLAVLSGHAVVARMLIRAGANLGVRDLKGETPLHIATSLNNVECLQALLAPVPEHPPRKLASILNQKNYNGQTCVHLAASLGHVEALQALVYFGADINEKEGLAGWTALHIAARTGNVPVISYLLKHCPGVVATSRDYANRSAKKLAAKQISHLFSVIDDSSDDMDSDDDLYESDSESLFETLRQSRNSIKVL